MCPSAQFFLDDMMDHSLVLLDQPAEEARFATAFGYFFSPGACFPIIKIFDVLAPAPGRYREVARVLTEIPTLVAAGCAFSAILYWSVGLEHENDGLDKFSFFLLTTVVNFVVAMLVGFTVAARSSTFFVRSFISLNLRLD